MHNYDALQTALNGPFQFLTQFNQFVLWGLETNPNGGKPRKMPYRIDGTRGSSTDPASWTDAATAMEAAKRSGMGVGFVLTDADPIVFIDVDGCYGNGQWDADALATVAQFPGAAFEVSQSCTGMHLFVAGQLPEGFTGRKRGKFECYRTGRFVALTGLNAVGSVLDFGPTVARFVVEKFPTEVIDSAVGPLRYTTGPIPEWQGPTDDEELLRQFLAAPRPATASDAFSHLKPDAPAVSAVAVSNADLFNANVAVLSQAYPSDKGDTFDRSNAAFALATRLAYWTGKDCARMERLMNRAAFRRSKADDYHDSEVTYMRWDVMRACAFTTRVMFQRAAVANAEVISNGAGAYGEYYDRLSAAGDVQTIRGICNEVGIDLRIDPINRKLLAGHVRKCIELLGERLPMADCESLVRMRSAHPAPDRQALQRQQNIAMNLPEDAPTIVPNMPIAQMLDDFVFIADGSQVGSVTDRTMCYALSDFRNLFAASRTLNADGKYIEHTEEWRLHGARRSVSTRTFHAGAPVITTDPNGRWALNMWRKGTPRSYTVDVTPFLEHIDYLFGDASARFLDWLAHIEQFPGVLPHHGWLHIADIPGAGRNWLSSVISRLWRGYVAPSVNLDRLINGDFNGPLAGRIIAIIDEIRAGGSENAYMMEGRIRNMITEETRSINPKYGREYMEHNACRWLVFSNHKDAIPLSDTDRRWDVVHLTASPRDEQTYQHLYSLLHVAGFVESVGAWLAQRDISRFNPGAKPPITDAKRVAIDASKSEFMKRAAQIVRVWPSDFITVSDVSHILNEGETASNGQTKRLTAAQRHALLDNGMHSLEMPIYDDNGNKQRVWVVRNVNQWLAAGVLTKENTAAHFAALRPHTKIGGFNTLLELLK